MAEWFDNYDRHFGVKGDETGAEEARFLRRVLHLRPGRSVLDVPCGAGRIAFHLARAGCRVTGVDLTGGYVKRARRRFAAAGLPGTFLQQDMRELDLCQEFDAAYNWQGSFGYFSDEENLDVLRRLAGALRPGGRLLIDQPNREWILRHFRARSDDQQVRRVTKWNPREQRVETVFISKADRRSWRMSIRFYTPGQFLRLFAQAGLVVEAMYGDLDASPYTQSSRRIHVVGRKP